MINIRAANEGNPQNYLGLMLDWKVTGEQTETRWHSSKPVDRPDANRPFTTMRTPTSSFMF